jgi:hypothetical protein
MQLKAAQILGCYGIGRALEECRQGLDVMDIVAARLLHEVAHHHIFDQTLAQGFTGCSVIGALLS